MTIRIHVSEQGNFFSEVSVEPLADGRAITIHGSALKALEDDTHAQFIAYTQAEIETQLRNYFDNASRDIDYTSEDGIFILDMEEPSDGVTCFAHPSSFHLATDAMKAEIVAAWKTRIRAARAVLPNARIVMYGVPVADGQGDPTDAVYLSRIAALITAGTSAGFNGVGSLYDELDAISPILYPRFGPDDNDAQWLSTEAYVYQAITGGLSIRRSNGEQVPLLPLFTMRVANGNSDNDEQQLLDIEPSLDRSLILPLLITEELGVTEAVFWVGSPDGEVLPDPNPNARTVSDYIARIKMILMPTATTSYGAILANWVSILEGLTPTSAQEYPFIRDTGVSVDAENNPEALFRVFSILTDTNRQDVGASDFQVEQVTDSAQVVIYYPHQFGLYGSENVRDMDSLIAEDARKIRVALGEFGRANYVAGQSLTRADHIVTRVDAEQITFLNIILTTTYYQALT